MKKNPNLDLIRIIAMLLVLVQHTWLNFTLRPDFFPSKLYFLLEIPVVFSKTAVLLFFILSGYLSLNKTYSIEQNTSKTLTRIGIPLLFFEACNVLYNRFFTQLSELSVQEFVFFEIERLQSFPSSALWFLVVLLYFYLLNPILQPLFQERSKKLALYLTAFTCCFTVVSTLYSYPAQSVTSLFTSFSGWTAYLFFYLLGGVIRNNWLPNKLDTYKFILALSSFILIYLGDYLSMLAQSRNQNPLFLNYSRNTLSIPVITLALSLFLILKSVRIHPATLRLITKLSAFSYGVYLIHPFVVAAFTNNLGFTFDHLGLNVYLYNALNFGLVLVISLGLTGLFKATPLLKKTIGE